MKQIDLTNNKEGKKSPFKVPEGYFENFTAQLMQNFPEEEQASKPMETKLQVKTLETDVTLFTRIKPYLYLAATICGLAFGIKVYTYQQQYFEDKNETSVISMTHQEAERYVDDMCDFAMIDDNDIYACATGNL